MGHRCRLRVSKQRHVVPGRCTSACLDSAFIACYCALCCVARGIRLGDHNQILACPKVRTPSPCSTWYSTNTNSCSLPPFSELAHIRLEPSGWALIASSDHTRARSVSPDDHFNFLVLFSPCWDSPLCLSGDGLALDTDGDAPIVRSRGQVQSFWRCDRSVLQDILNKSEAPDLILLRSESTHFVAIYSRASASVHILPASLPIGQWSTVGVHGLDSLVQSPHLALHAPAAQHACFHSSASASVLVPPPGGYFTISSVHPTDAGDRVAVLQPRESVPAPNALSLPFHARVLQSRSKISPVVMLWTLVLYIFGVIVRLLHRLGPVRHIVPQYIERCEHRVVHPLSQRPGTPLRSVATRLGYRATGADGDGTPATTRTATFLVATKQNIPDGAVLLVHNTSRRSDNVSSMPAVFCDDKQLETDSASTLDSKSGPVMLAVKLPVQLDTATSQRTLRVEF